MKVLSKGRKQKGYSSKRICTGNGNGGGGCGAKLLVEQADLYLTSNSDMKGDTDHFVTFVCPECGVETDIGCPSSKEEEIAKENSRRRPIGRDDT
jgi:predicted RNA-binding Zn-ribbon protein involved in translation (DUF1610 family)